MYRIFLDNSPMTQITTNTGSFYIPIADTPIEPPPIKQLMFLINTSRAVWWR